MKISRRQFLHLGALGAGVVVLGGLVREFGGSSGPGSLTAPSLGELLGARKKAGAAGGLGVHLAGEDYVASTDTYLAFFLDRNKGADRLFGSDTRVWLTPTVDPAARITPMGPYQAPWFGYAHPEGKAPTLPQGLNALNVTFDRPGIWTIVAETTTGPHLIGSSVVESSGTGADLGVKRQGHSDNKVPGDPAIPSETPTVASPRGVSPICTRRPQCDMHQITLKEAIANGKPTAFYVGTPAFCQSRNCGPSLEELIVVEDALRDRVNFVHAEVYLNDQPQTIEQQIAAPTFTQWGLQSEPWLYLIDRKGIIASRFEGGFTAGRIRQALDPLVG